MPIFYFALIKPCVAVGNINAKFTISHNKYKNINNLSQIHMNYKFE